MFAVRPLINPNALCALLAATLVSVAANAHATENTDSMTTPASKLWLVANLASYHVQPEMKYNQRNLGAGLEYHHSEDVLFMTGLYRNSVFRQSGYALAAWTPLHVGPFSIGGAAGFINGYPELNNGHVGPIAAGMVRLEGRDSLARWGANLMILPPVPQKKSPLTFGLQVKYRF